MISLISLSQDYDKLLQNELKNGCFKASFQNLSNEGIALININAADRSTSDLLTSCFDYGIKVMSYDKSIDLLDSENILKELSEKISTKARYFFLIKGEQGELYDSKNDFELVGYFKCLSFNKFLKWEKNKTILRLMANHVAKKMKESIQN